MKFFTPPVFDDEDQTRIARLNHSFVLLVSFFVTLRAIGFLGALPESAPLLWISAGVLLACLALLRLVHLGRVRLTAYLSATTFWLAANSAAVAAGGVDRPLFSTNLTVLIFVALTLGARATAGFALASLLAGVGMLWARFNGLLPTPTFAADLVVGATTQLINVTVAAVYLGIVAHSLQDAFKLARQNGRALVERNRALENEVAERQRAEAALQRSELIYRQAIAASGAVPYYRDYGSNTYTFMGENILAMTGYSAAEMTPALFDSLFEEGIPRGALAHLSYAEADQLTEDDSSILWECDYRIHTRDGQTRWLADTSVKGLNEQGQRVGVVGILQDITERKQAEAEIHQLNAALNQRVAVLTALHETGLDLSAQLELPTLLRTIMERGARLVQAPMGGVYLLQPNGLTLQPVANLPPEDVSSPVRVGEGLVGRVAENVAPMIVDDYRQWPGRLSDDVSFCAVASVPIVWQGQVLGVISLCDTRPARFGPGDVEAVRLLAAQAAVAIVNARLLADTQRQVRELSLLHAVAVAAAEAEGEEALIARMAHIISEHFASDVLDIFLLDTAAGVLRPQAATQGAGRETRPYTVPLGQGITGIAAARGQPWRVADVTREPAYLAAHLDTCSELAVPLKVAERVIGVLNLESVRLNAFSEADERLLLTIAGQFATAIERLRAQAEIRQLNAELEARVRERTAQLEEVNKELESFAYSISHDLRAPLRTIDGFARIVQEDYAPRLDSQAQSYLQRVRDGAQRMGALIDDLLAFSRLGRQTLHTTLMTRQTLRSLVVQIVDELRVAEPEREIEVAVGVLPECRADPALLRQVWTNLIANAFKYTRGRVPAQIEVGVAETSDGPAYFVRDNGVGFDPRYAAKLFGVFQRLHRPDEFEGTGVGLAIVQRIVHRHGGRVWAEAEADKGAAFYFTLGAPAETP
jgi:PAS domain S-box-containing protein